MHKPPKCGDCEFWVEENKQRRGFVYGQCKIDSAKLDPSGYGCWPLTLPTDFCYKGQHKNRQLLTEAIVEHPDPPKKRIISEDVVAFWSKPPHEQNRMILDAKEEDDEV